MTGLACFMKLQRLLIHHTFAEVLLQKPDAQAVTGVSRWMGRLSPVKLGSLSTGSSVSAYEMAPQGKSDFAFSGLSGEWQRRAGQPPFAWVT